MHHTLFHRTSRVMLSALRFPTSPDIAHTLFDAHSLGKIGQSLYTTTTVHAHMASHENTSISYDTTHMTLHYIQYIHVYILLHMQIRNTCAHVRVHAHAHAHIQMPRHASVDTFR